MVSLLFVCFIVLMNAVYYRGAAYIVLKCTYSWKWAQPFCVVEKTGSWAGFGFCGSYGHLWCTRFQFPPVGADVTSCLVWGLWSRWVFLSVPALSGQLWEVLVCLHHREGPSPSPSIKLLFLVPGVGAWWNFLNPSCPSLILSRPCTLCLVCAQV